MYKSIIYTTNLETLKKMYNLIFSDRNNFCINLTKIATSYEELLFLHKKFNFNMIILSASDMENENIFHLAKNFENKIIFTNNISNFKNTKSSLYLSPEDNSKYTYEKLKKFLSKIDERTIRKKTRRILESLKFNLKLNGSIYLLESIVYSYMHKEEYLFENLEQNIFPYIAKLYNTTNESAKWAIIRSINNVKFQYSTNSFKGFADKITPKTLITEIVNRI